MCVLFLSFLTECGLTLLHVYFIDQKNFVSVIRAVETSLGIVSSNRPFNISSSLAGIANGQNPAVASALQASIPLIENLVAQLGLGTQAPSRTPLFTKCDRFLHCSSRRC